MMHCHHSAFIIHHLVLFLKSQAPSLFPSVFSVPPWRIILPGYLPCNSLSLALTSSACPLAVTVGQ